MTSISAIDRTESSGDATSREKSVKAKIWYEFCIKFRFQRNEFETNKFVSSNKLKRFEWNEFETKFVNGP